MSGSSKEHKQTKAKISRKEAEDFAVSRMNEIRASNDTSGVKAQKERRLGKSCIVRLKGRSSRSSSNTPSLSYLNREITKLRTFLRHEGFLRHDFHESLEGIKNDYPIVNKEIDSLRDITLNNAKEMISDVAKKIDNRYSRTKDKDKKSQLRKAAAMLRKVKFEPVVFETLVRTSTQKEELAKAASERVERYLSSQRIIDYKETYSLMGRLLAAKHDWQGLVLGLVLASGRRSTEIVCEQDGQFKSVRKKMEVEFTSHIKTKEPKTYRIPLLVDYKTFSSALERLRSHPRIAGLMEKTGEIANPDKRHRAINASIQNQLSVYVKSVMGKEWQLKDGRAMYARIAYAEYCAAAKKTGKTPEVDDLFFKEKLGHTDVATQQNYKQFTLQNAEQLDDSEVKQVKKDAVKQTSQDRLKALKELFDSEEIRGSRAFSRYAEGVLQHVSKDPSLKITSTWIKSTLEGNKGIISKFVKIVRDAGLQTAS